ncbi:hypothetical protein AAHC03_01688 [Spirometra sp. Aus1]
MDDEELAQDVLDQFDLVCTQYTATSEASSNYVPKNQNRSKTPGLLGGFKLSKTSSLDANMSRGPGFDVRQHHQNEDEVQHLKDEIAALKEELYMKVGELSSLKEASSRNAAANLETVRKLKTQLASEREEARKTLTALGSQLAFREADYQLVASELAQAKEAMASQSLAYATDAPPTAAATGTHTITDVSPASALLISMASQSPSDHRKSIGCGFTSPELAPRNLPVVVTPVPSRRSRRQAVWNNELGTQQQHLLAEHAPRVALLNPNDGMRPPEVKSDFCRTNGDAKMQSKKTITETEGAAEGGSQRTPCKRPRTDTPPSTPTHPSRTPIAPTATLPFQPRHGLHHRCNLEAFIRSRGGGDKGADVTNRKQQLTPSVSIQLVRDLAHLASLAPPLPLPESDPSQRCFGWLIEDNASTFASPPEVEFLHGLNILSQTSQSVGVRSPCSANQLTPLCQALPHLLQLIRYRLHRYIDFFFRYRTQKGGFGHLSSSASNSTARQDLSTSRNAEETSSTNPSPVVELTEDPFAGALASQVVPIPSSTSSNHQQSTALTALDTSLDLSFLSTSGRISPGSHWLTTCASLSTSGALACLQQLLLLTQAFSTGWADGQCSATALREVASLAGWTISAVAHVLTGPKNRLGPGGRVLRDLRPGWTRQLTRVAEFAIYLACLLSPGLTSDVGLAVCNVKGSPTQHKMDASVENTPQRCQQKRPSRLSLHVLAPLLRLLTRLVEGCQLPAFDHDWLRDANSIVVAPCWWCSSSAPPDTLDYSKCAASLTAELLLSDLLTRMQLLRVAGTRQPERIIALENCVLRQVTSSSQSTREGSLQHQLGCPLSLLCKLILTNWGQHREVRPTSAPRHRLDDEVTVSGPVRKCCLLLTEFSSLITALLVKRQLPASSSCTCTAEVYSTLISLGVSPTEWLFRLSQSTAGLRLTATCLSALGQLMQTLQGLLQVHGEDAFQSFTDRVPAFFCVISNLSRWCRYSAYSLEGNTAVACLLRPQLVEELNDFDSGVAVVHTTPVQPRTPTCI